MLRINTGFSRESMLRIIFHRARGHKHVRLAMCGGVRVRTVKAVRRWPRHCYPRRARLHDKRARSVDGMSDSVKWSRPLVGPPQTIPS
eukprot:scaffold17741_cov66-Phaeocystis_antarctica.AAC.1